MGERLIKAGVLYADDTPVEQMREVRRGPPALGQGFRLAALSLRVGARARLCKGVSLGAAREGARGGGGGGGPW